MNVCDLFLLPGRWASDGRIPLRRSKETLYKASFSRLCGS